MFWFVAACLVPAFVISWAGTLLMRRWAPRWGLIDQPAARKVHLNPTPLGGGVAIYVGVLAPLLTAQFGAWLLLRLQPDWITETQSSYLGGILYRSGQLWGILAAGTIMMVMGLLDDRFGLSWKWRLLIQFLLAIGLVSAGVRGTIFLDQPWIGMVLTVFWMVVLINSLNFLDNMDGLAGGIGLIASLMFAQVMLGTGGEVRWLVGGCLLVLAGSIAGFLLHNWTPAKIFMGDAGSTFIGLLLASMTVLGTFYDDSSRDRHVILAPLCILAIPFYDFFSVILIRLSRGKSPFQPDRNHFSHRLTDLGLSRRNAVLTVHFATLTTGLGALLLYEVEGWKGASLVIALELCLLVIVSILETTGRLRAQELKEGQAPKP
ncbi:MraY family glycosyltransferase [Planctomicrobium sp. SH664]|uniref:MraY family glycosyltransferase n=1 Tax=Planctomicrobium sp. SH664 TaxID=3448125 RepID=UPI003F5C9FC0